MSLQEDLRVYVRSLLRYMLVLIGGTLFLIYRTKTSLSDVGVNAHVYLASPVVCTCYECRLKACGSLVSNHFPSII